MYKKLNQARGINKYLNMKVFVLKKIRIINKEKSLHETFVLKKTRERAALKPREIPCERQVH